MTKNNNNVSQDIERRLTARFEPVVYRVKNNTPASWGAEITEVACRFFYRGQVDELKGTGKIRKASGEWAEVEGRKDLCCQKLYAIIEVSIGDESTSIDAAAKIDNLEKCFTVVEDSVGPGREIDAAFPKSRISNLVLKKVE